MKELVIDCETTTKESGSPYSSDNRLCLVGCLWDSVYTSYRIEYDSEPYGKALEAIRDLVEEADVVIGHNIKFDLAWLKRYIPTLQVKKVRDTQLIEYLYSGQQISFPSLNQSLLMHGLEPKLDKVKELWQNGVDTPDIPLYILEPYLEQDVRQTYKLYQHQLKDARYRVIEELLDIQCRDLLVLLDIERHGLKMDMKGIQLESVILATKIKEIEADLKSFADINWGSAQQVSVVLYGGFIAGRKFEPLLKPNKRDERTATANYSDEELALLNEKRLLEKKQPMQRVYSVQEENLMRLKLDKETKRIITKYLELKKLNKLKSTYMDGILEIIETFGWVDTLHPIYNLVSTRTGRLSSNRPNAQNFPDELEKYVTSRY